MWFYGYNVPVIVLCNGYCVVPICLSLVNLILGPHRVWSLYVMIYICMVVSVTHFGSCIRRLKAFYWFHGLVDLKTYYVLERVSYKF